MTSLAEYLRTSYPDGDREFVDGRIVERNLGEFSHADAQSRMVFYLRTHYPGLWSVVSVRTQVSPTRIRVPDVVTVLGSQPQGRIVTEPPALVVEVLSPDDRAGDLQEKLDDYFSFGIPTVWVLNPRTRRGHVHTPGRSEEPADGILRAGEIAVPLAEIIPARSLP